MGSVIVKGMEMPKTCNDCGLRDSFDCWITDSYIEARFSKRNEDCPLVEIPTPHGDLVDRNKLLAEYDRQHEGEAGKARKIMEQAKAVIEAEGSET